METQQIHFELFGGGTLVGEANGTWRLYEVSRYERSNGAYAAANSTLELTYVELGQSFHVIVETAVADNPPADLGGSLQVGSFSTATTSETITQVSTVNGVTGSPVTQTTSITLTQRVVGYGSVTVPAGTFDAWIIEFTRSDDPGVATLNYNETVGNWVSLDARDSFGALTSSYRLKEYRYTAGGGAPVAPLATYALPLGAVAATGAAVAAVVWWARRRPPAAASVLAPPVPPPPLPPRTP